MLGTSARIGEVLAIRKRDVDVTCSPPTVRICGTVISPTGKPTYRQDHPKTSKSRRTISIPTFTAEVLRQRLVVIASEDPEHLVFFSRNHTPLTTNNVRRRLRAILDEAGIGGVTPHSFRRTVATVLDRAGGADLAAEMLGHTSSDITRAHYIEPDERVNPVTAEILESLAPRRAERSDRLSSDTGLLLRTQYRPPEFVEVTGRFPKWNRPRADHVPDWRREMSVRRAADGRTTSARQPGVDNPTSTATGTERARTLSPGSWPAAVRHARSGRSRPRRRRT